MGLMRQGWSRVLLGAALLLLALVGLGCKDIVEAPTALTYATNPAVYTAGTAITSNVPAHTGGDIDSYAVSPTLPAGLVLAARTGIISGTPTTATALATYTVTATNSAGSTTASLSITVEGPPLSITSQPSSQAILVGGSATFTVVASGTGTLTYQWFLNGTAITGATSPDHTTPAVALADSGGVYTVTVSDAFGGSVTSTSATLTVRASVSTGVFISTGSMANGRNLHTATLLNTGKVLVAGGYLAGPLQSLELFDVAAGTFSSAGNLVTARYGHTATLLPSGKVLLAGGYTFGAPTTSAELYDPVAGTVTSAGTLTKARAHHTATLLANGTVLIVAGRDSLAIHQTAEIYDPATGLFTATTGAPLAFRFSHTASRLANGQVLLAGGYGANTLASAELYNPATGTFAATGSMTVGRYWHSAVVLGTGKVLVAGGSTSLSAELYDPTGGTFTATGSLSGTRFSHTATLLADGSVLLAGGKSSDPNASGALLATAETFNPTTGLFTSAGSLVQGRYYHTATLVSGKVLLAGGIGTSYTSAELYF